MSEKLSNYAFYWKRPLTGYCMPSKGVVLRHMKNTALFLALIAVLVVVGVFVKGPQDTQAETRIGVIAPLTGLLAFYGEDIRRGILDSGIAPSSLIIEDEKCEPAPAVSAFTKLVEVDKVPLIIGPACGSPQEAIVPILKDRDVVVLVPSAASAKLFEQSGGKLFNIQYSLEDEAAFLAKSIYERDQKRVVLITYQNAFSRTVAESFKANFKGEVVREISFVDDRSDVSTELAKLEGAEFDAIFSADITFFFMQGMEKLSLYGIEAPVYAQYGMELPVVRPLGEGVYYSYPRGIEGSQGATYALAREAASIGRSAVAACGADTSCIRKHLVDSGSFDERGLSTRGMLLKQIKNGEPVVVR